MNRQPIFENAAWSELQAELGEEDTCEILRAFLTDTGAKVRAIVAGNLGRPELQREAHSIKSSAATLGFEELSRLGRELEFGAMTMNSEELGGFCQLLDSVFERTAEFARTNLLSKSLENAL
jgi:HPt (histidine-containing phosphotransfer) domain-containing protein